MILKRNLFIFLITFTFFIFSIIIGVNILYALSLSLVLFTIMVYFGTIGKDFSIVFFLISQFFFLMGCEFTEKYFGIKLIRDSSMQANEHYQIAIFLSLVSLIIGYRIKLSKKTNVFENISIDENSEKKSVRSVSKNIFYLTFFFYLMPLVEKIIFLQDNSYYDSYVDYYSRLPSIIFYIGNICPVAFSVFIATFPTKKESKLVFIMFTIYSILYLFTGKRFMTISSLILILTYFLIRNETDKKSGIVWISKKSIAVVIFLIPILAIMLSAISIIRVGAKIDSSTTSGKLIYNLMTSVGDADKVIKYGYDYKDKIPQGHIYSLGNIIDYVRTSKLFEIITGEDLKVGQTADYAMNGNNFAYTLSYLVYPNKYLTGHGLGSCYIAELYQDVGYIGVIIGSFLLGIFLSNLFSITSNSIWKNAIIFYAYKWIMLAPRGSYDVAFREILSISFLTYIVFIFLVAKTKKRNMKKVGIYNEKT